MNKQWLPIKWLWVAAVLLIAAVWLAYAPGLGGPFLFDDYSNLAPLGSYGPIHLFWQVVAWITSGFAGPTGRPVALASFLIDARNWPAPPEIFKQTNVWIHLINGVLLMGLSGALARGLGVTRQRSVWVGLLAAGIWLFQPLWVSTTLYVIQRMAMLAALFVFAGLWAYAHGRLQLQQGHRRSAYIWMSVGLGLGTLLAVFSKENGALLPLFAWLLEAFVFDRDSRALDRHGTGFVWWRRLFVILPSLLLLGYMAWQLPMLFSGLTYGRDFTPGERLLTETRILWSYLVALWLPGTHLGGLFHDDNQISTSLLRPLTTLFGAFGLLLLAGLAVMLRSFARTVFWRSVGLAIAFFLVGHLLESSWLPLELSFEHRNYLPAGLMFLPLAVLLTDKWPRHRTVVTWVVIGLMAGLALLTAKRADLWGKPFQQALVWAHKHPNSPRAQSYLANFWDKVGNYPESNRLLDNAIRKHPDSLLLLANRAMTACMAGNWPPGLMDKLLHLSRTGGLARNVTGYQFDRLLDSLSGKSCGDLGAKDEYHLITAALQNPVVRHAPEEHRSLLHRRALYWLGRKQPEKAYRDYLAALRLPNLSPGVRLRFAAELATAHQPRLALQLLDAVPSPLAHIHGWSMPKIHQRWLRHVGFYQKSEAHLRKELHQDIQSSGHTPGKSG